MKNYCCNRNPSSKEIKELDALIVPCQLTNKTLCKCPPPCLVVLIVDFLARLNRIKNQSNFSPTCGTSVNSPGDKFFGPTIVKWKTEYEVETGKKIVLCQEEMRALFDFMSSGKSKFGMISRIILDQVQQKQYARHLIGPGGSLSVSQNTRFSCIKTEHRYARKVKSANHNNCCGYARKECGSCCDKRATCEWTKCY